MCSGYRQKERITTARQPYAPRPTLSVRPLQPQDVHSGGNTSRRYRPCLRAVAVVWTLLAGGCISPQTAVTADVDPAGWDAAGKARVAFENTDSLRTCEIRIVLRYNGSAPSRTIPLVIETVTPDSLATTERVAVTVPAHRGMASAMDETSAAYRTGVRLGRTGQYVFTIYPAPGQAPVKGITAVGLEFI